MHTRFERIRIFTPLGIRFWDPVRDTQVSDNLIVTARTECPYGRVTTAFRTASGIYAFQGLSGLHAVEYPPDETAFAASPPPAATRFIIEVHDQLRRFLPTVFHVDLPLPYTGIFPETVLSSPPTANPPGFYLFSAPTWPAAPGIAAIRGCLAEAFTHTPAAYAVVEVDVANRTWYGIADARGCVAVLFPYPTLQNTLGDSPPGSSQLPLQQQTWPVDIRVRYAPASLSQPSGADVPELRSLFSQPSGVLWSTQSGPPTSVWSATLQFGQELIMRTDDLSVLWISAGTSPP